MRAGGTRRTDDDKPRSNTMTRKQAKWNMRAGKNGTWNVYMGREVVFYNRTKKQAARLVKDQGCTRVRDDAVAFMQF
jgi:hypothetical protein